MKYIIPIILLLSSCSTNRGITDEIVVDGKTEVYIERNEWTAFGVGICGQFLFNYSSTSRYKVVLPDKVGSYDLGQVEIYYKDNQMGWRREFDGDYYKGKIDLEPGFMTVDITGYKGESVSYFNGRYSKK
jgi:hypothetical protein